MSVQNERQDKDHDHPFPNATIPQPHSLSAWKTTRIRIPCQNDELVDNVFSCMDVLRRYAVLGTTHGAVAVLPRSQLEAVSSSCVVDNVVRVAPSPTSDPAIRHIKLNGNSERHFACSSDHGLWVYLTCDAVSGAPLLLQHASFSIKVSSLAWHSTKDILYLGFEDGSIARLTLYDIRETDVVYFWKEKYSITRLSVGDAYLVALTTQRSVSFRLDATEVVAKSGSLEANPIGTRYNGTLGMVCVASTVFCLRAGNRLWVAHASSGQVKSTLRYERTVGDSVGCRETTREEEKQMCLVGELHAVFDTPLCHRLVCVPPSFDSFYFLDTARADVTLFPLAFGLSDVEIRCVRFSGGSCFIMTSVGIVFSACVDDLLSEGKREETQTGVENSVEISGLPTDSHTSHGADERIAEQTACVQKERSSVKMNTRIVTKRVLRVRNKRRESNAPTVAPLCNATSDAFAAKPTDQVTDSCSGRMDGEDATNRDWNGKAFNISREEQQQGMSLDSSYPQGFAAVHNKDSTSLVESRDPNKPKGRLQTMTEEVRLVLLPVSGLDEFRPMNESDLQRLHTWLTCVIELPDVMRIIDRGEVVEELAGLTALKVIQLTCHYIVHPKADDGLRRRVLRTILQMQTLQSNHILAMIWCLNARAINSTLVSLLLNCVLHPNRLPLPPNMNHDHLDKEPLHALDTAILDADTSVFQMIRNPTDPRRELATVLWYLPYLFCLDGPKAIALCVELFPVITAQNVRDATLVEIQSYCSNRLSGLTRSISESLLRDVVEMHDHFEDTFLDYLARVIDTHAYVKSNDDFSILYLTTHVRRFVSIEKVVRHRHTPSHQRKTRILLQRIIEVLEEDSGWCLDIAYVSDMMFQERFYPGLHFLDQAHNFCERALREDDMEALFALLQPSISQYEAYFSNECAASTTASMRFTCNLSSQLLLRIMKQPSKDEWIELLHVAKTMDNETPNPTGNTYVERICTMALVILTRDYGHHWAVPFIQEIFQTVIRGNSPLYHELSKKLQALVC